MTNKETARAEIADLIARYDALPTAKRRALSEMDTRRVFILPLFDALGWDTTGNPDEVAEEVSGVAGRADYAFRIGGITRFLLEAKAMREDLDKPHHAVQAVSYAYNRGVPWAVLSDFEGLKVYYTEWEVDEVARCQVMDLRYDEYLEEFDLLWRLSKPAFQEDALRKHTERRYGAVGRRTPVGDHLLAQFVNWREELFKYFWMYNHDRGHTLPQIDEAIQRLLDRLIFIRTCEDRRIEEPRLLPLLRGREGGALSKDLWSLLLDLFRDFDAIYDSRLFEPHLVDSLACEETPFRAILQGLYFSAGPVRYQFDVIPADVLGRVYEQYLGFVAQTAKEVARQEASQAALPGFEPATDQTIELVSKKLKRKMHGIYYTPQFVVDYIVEQTLGQVLAERTLDEVRDLAVLDMACGSGSFLITAYERLLRHHAEALQQPALSQEERLEILTRNVYGVDLDGQAVEVAQLNLLLKALETPRDLPNLNSNVKRGNSLVEGGARELEPHFGEHWRTVARPLNWKRAFPQPMQRGGFDVIVGNPPYVRIQTLPDADKAYYKERYQAATGNYDIYTLFVERGWQLLRPGGVLGFILPNKFFSVDYGQGLRRLLSQERAVWRVVDFGDAQVFGDATTYTCLFFLRKKPNPRLVYISASDWLKGEELSPGKLPDDLPKTDVVSQSLSDNSWLFLSETESQIVEKLLSLGVLLLDLPAKMSRGSSSGNDKVFMLKGDLDSDTFSSDDGLLVQLEPQLLRIPVFATDFGRYTFHPQSGKVIIFPYRRRDNTGEFSLLSQEELETSFPKVYGYLRSRKELLEKRKQFREWYSFSAPRNLAVHDSAHLLIPLLADRGLVAKLPLERDKYCLMASGGFSISIGSSCNLSPQYVLGLLNSKLLFWYLTMMSNLFRSGWITCTKQYVGRIPIRCIDFDDPTQAAQHDAVVARVEELLRLYARRAELPEIDERAAVQAAIDAEEATLDALVYELYGLTEKEIALVEGQ